MTSPSIIMLCGVPTSGKSSWCKNNTDFTIISSDNIIENYASSVGLSYNEVFDDYIKEAVSLMLEQLKYSVAFDKNIICDQTHLTSKIRKRKLKMIPEYYKKVAVYFEISKDEMLKRNHNEDRTKTVPQRVLLQMFDAYKRPSVEEGFDEVYDGHLKKCPDFSLS